MALSNNRISLCLQAAALAVLGSAPLMADDKPVFQLNIKQGPPPGFERLAGPQETVVDLSYGGLKIGSFRAVYTAKTITFAAPEEIVNKIPSLKHDAVARVVQALTGDLPTEAARICGHQPRKDCGTLKPDVAGVIFYEEAFRADVFVNPAMLDTQDTHTDKILPPAPDVFSAIHTLNGSVIGSSEQDRIYSLLDNSTIAYGPERLNFVGIASNQQKQINTLTASLDKWGLDNEAGFFNSRALQLLPQTPMSGVSVGTSLKTNLELRDAAGSTLSIFLPQRSYVSLIYNNVIYSTDLYDAGNQILNTSSLPEGAYEVTIRIRDLNGVQTEQKQFFAKNFAIPPLDQPIYFAQAGTVRNTSSTGAITGFGTTPILDAGMIRRLGKNSAIDTDFLFINNTFFTEAGAFLLLPPDHQFQISGLASSSRDIGFGASYLGYGLSKKLAFSSNLRVIFAGNHPAITDTTTLDNPIQGNTRQLTSTLSYQMTPKANVGFQANYNQSENTATQYAYGPELRYDFWREGPNSLMLTANADNTQHGLQETIFLNLNLRFGAWGYSGQAEFANNAGSTAAATGATESGDARVTWNDDKDPGRLTIIGAETTRDNTSSSYITDLDHRGNYGNVKLIASETDTNGQGNNTFYSGNFGITLAHTAHEIAVGGNDQENSGFILENTGNSVGVPMQVFVDNSQRTTFDTGTTASLFLAPYQTYRVSVKPAQSSSIDYDGSVKNITLYPGNILPLIWDINRVSVVVGHVVLPDGTPLIDARLEEARNISVTDSDGLFQGELLALKAITFNRAAERPSFFNNTGVDIFATPPSIRPYANPPSSMSVEAQRKAILSLFGEQEEGPPEAAAPVPQQKKPAPEPVLSPRKLLPELRCRVTLPEVKETNGVYIYPDPLVCMPLPPEEGKNAPDAVKPPAPKTSAAVLWSASAAPVSERENNAISWLFAASADQKATHPRPIETMAAGAPGPQTSNAPAPDAAAHVLDRMLGEDAAHDKAATVPFGPQLPQGGPFLDITTLPSADAPQAPVKHAEADAAQISADSIQVQVGSYRTDSKARQAHSLLKARYKELADKPYAVVRADLGEKGVFYRLRIGHFASRNEAAAFCGVLASKGQACMVAPSGGRE